MLRIWETRRGGSRDADPFATYSGQMASGHWLLFFFSYCSKGLVTADDPANRTIEDNAETEMLGSK